jgi:spore maturation protein CgeB
VWQTVEDPNSYTAFLPQAAGYDVIATSDADLIPQYRDRFPGSRVIWLPMAAQPALHTPRALVENPADLVLIANWYTNDARSAAIRTVLDPLLAEGMTLALYAYQTPPFVWPDPYARWWRAKTVCYDVATYYPGGRVALGMNNQAWGTAMCSMRTFEVLACGKPFLSFHSDAYARLGFINAGPDLDAGHFVWIDNPADAVRAAKSLLARTADAQEMADRGRAFVLEHHCYAHRLQTICEALGV